MRHVLCSVMEFDDGSVSVIPMHRGTLDECEELAGKIPAVTNSTRKRLVQAFWACPTEEEFNSAMSEGHDTEGL